MAAPALDNATPRPARTGADTTLLGRTGKTVEHNADRLAGRLHRWMRRYARAEARRQIEMFEASAAARYVFAKARRTPGRRELAAELRQILEEEGLRMFSRATRRTAGMRAAEISDRAMREFMGTKRIRLQQIMRSTQIAVENSVRQIILTANDEIPRPTVNEIGRRIARTYHGDTGGEEYFRGPSPDPRFEPVRVLPTDRVRLTNDGNLYHFSFERAHLIARTEMAQAENHGIVEGYKQTGVKGLKWLAVTSDNKTGGRRHDEMNGVTTRIGVPFVLPDGTRMRFPGDPMAPIGHLANCRCTVAPILLEEDFD